MYTAIVFGSVPSAGLRSEPLDIRVRESEVVLPLKMAYVVGVMNAAAARNIDFVISRSRLHRTDPPSATQMFNGGPVFFGHQRIQLVVTTQVGMTLNNQRYEVDLRGITVAGDLTVCVDQSGGVNVRIRCEFYYEIASVDRAAKAMAIWRGEVRPVPA